MKKEELAKYAGNTIYALCRRMGGKYVDINCLTVYEITERGTLRYQYEAMSCVANKSQYASMEEITKGNYVTGRPTAAKIDTRQISALIK